MIIIREQYPERAGYRRRPDMDTDNGEAWSVPGGGVMLWPKDQGEMMVHTADFGNGAIPPPVRNRWA